MKSFGNTIWKKAAILGLAACMALTACDNGKGGAESKNPAESIEESVSQSASEAVNAQSGESTESTPESSEPAQEALSADAKELFEAIQGWEFMFSSGAGGWDTSFQVDENGAFSGQFHDSDMGDTGEGYDNGTLYLSLFSGNFTGVKKISEYTYEATVTGLTYENTPGTEEIVDGVRRMYTEAYGLIGTDKVQIYLPGKKVSELSEEFIGWMMDLGGVYVFGQYYNDYPEELPFCGIYNPGTKEGFSSTNYSGKNLVYLRNKAAFPGLKNIRMDMNADGTYFCQDMNDLGTYVVTNLCYKQTNGQADTEAFINDVISHFVEGKSYA
ncbi:MAG: hypothetical protein J6Z22_09160, partial [Lachnospiraceae bacterium]|nr:hypothetical protein [Lachnospiraceae bacterium]